MPGVPDPSLMPQVMRKGHKIRAMLDDDFDTARAEICAALDYLIKDHDPPEDGEPDEGSSVAGGP